MKYLSYLFVALMIVSCDPCRRIDCYQSGLQFRFRVVDDKGKDLVYDLDVSISSLSLQSPNGSKESITTSDAPDRSLYVLLSPDKLTYVLSHESKSTEITLSAEKVNDGECCGPLYETTEVSTPDGRVPVIASPSSGQRIFIITL